ncbi:hypothetical protein [Natrinema sp. DC36]|uniref:hypothetical protein n=1 Tax=Natrinema sp. DC36 TaxID=2878680 RepID=UPI001CEFE35B|nr:hypothetical protein [Natrinema sp. DC36]
MAVLGATGLGALSGTASGRRGSGDGPTTGNQPWYEWDADVDAGGNGLYDLGRLQAGHVHTAARDPVSSTEYRSCGLSRVGTQFFRRCPLHSHSSALPNRIGFYRDTRCTHALAGDPDRFPAFRRESPKLCPSPGTGN